MTTPMTFSKTKNGGYQVTNSNGRDERAERFINEDGPETAARHRVAAGITDFFADAFDVDVKRRNWGQCRTPKERANAIEGLDRIFNEDRVFTRDELSIAYTFELTNNVVKPMERVLSILRDNLNSLQDHDKEIYENYAYNIVVQYCNLARPEQDAKAVESLDDDGLIRILTLLSDLGYDDFTVITSIMDRLEQLGKIGIRYTVDEPEDLLAPDVAFSIKSIERPCFNSYFALMTRPDGLDIHEAAARLPHLNEKVSSFLMPFDFLNSETFDGYFTWSALNHDWDSIEFPLASQPAEGSHALTLALEDREVNPDKVRKLIELFFPSRMEDDEFDDLNERILGDMSRRNTKFGSIRSLQNTMKNVALAHDDIDLLKAWSWLEDLALRLSSVVNPDRDYGDEHFYQVSVSRDSVVKALDHYNDGLPWSFIIETMKNYEDDSHPMSVEFSTQRYDYENEKNIYRNYFIYLYG